MRVFAIKRFYKWAGKHDLSDELLLSAVKEIEAGLVDADLGGNLYKKRIATKGRGKRSSVRTLLAFSTGKATFYLLGFEKSERDTIKPDEKAALQELALAYLDLSKKELEQRLSKGALIEVEEKENGQNEH